MATSVGSTPPPAGVAGRHPRTEPPAGRPLAAAARRWLGLIGPGLLLAVVAVLSVLPVLPPGAADRDAPATDFSAARAMVHLERLAQQPRPTGSAYARQVRDHLRDSLAALGFQTQVQRTTAIHEKQPTHFHAGVVENVVGRLRGTGDGSAIALVAHYDSVAAGPGANDDGVAVAAILEAARALTSGGQLRHDLIVLFTDGEEFGLLGAHAFVEESPWAKDTRLLLNFEARGRDGASVMFESSAGNAELIDGLASVSHPVSSSVGDLVYGALPNETDFTVFEAAGIRGMNFAYIEGQAHYHNAADSLASVRPGTVQHHGEYAVQLTRHFDRRGLPDAAGSDAVYFTVPWLGLVHYPAGWALPLTGLALLALVVATVLGIRRGRVSARLTVAAAGLVLAGVVLPAGVTAGVWWLVRQLTPVLDRFHAGDPYNGWVYLTAFGFLGLALSTAWLGFWWRRLDLEHLFLGAALWWAVLAAAAAVVAPAAGYVFTWPLLAAAAGLAYRYLRCGPRQPAARQLLALLPAAVVAVLLLGPVIYLLVRAVGPAFAFTGVVLEAFVLGLAVVALRLDWAATRRWLPITLGLVAVALLVAGPYSTGFNRSHPKPSNMFYALDGDTGEAFWGVLDEEPERWNDGLVSRYRSGPMPAFFRMPLGFHVGPAPAAKVPAPTATVLSNTVVDGVRTVRLVLKAGRPAPMVEIISLSDARVRAFTVDGRRIVNTSPRDPYGYRWSLHYIAPPAEGVDVTIEVESAEPFPVRLLDRSYDTEALPELRDLVDRPADTMPGNEDGDFVMVSKGLTIG